MDIKMITYVVAQTLIACTCITVWTLFYVALNPPDERPAWARSQAGFDAQFVGR